MQFKFGAIAALLVPLCAGFSIQAPDAATFNTPLDINWNVSKGDPDAFNIQLVQDKAIVLVKNVPSENLTTQVILPDDSKLKGNDPNGKWFLEFVDVKNSKDVFNKSDSFFIAIPG